ncbi:hypothetical protein Hbl1158_12260 [Halobaculum sp. CBA1158]|uniref:DUF7524 family protein n=1 Tax=Halobaculum sp. CBA1158 TaxID=2904243 RepID=UPI001F284820|nr:hypothetical protein [Halobaculum sp. CBA1158]UIO99296.1 hypothetical protein Hbl1158_12260 [Halobaculum sp. CBA1158]
MSSQAITLAVALNRDRLNQAIAPDSLVVDGSFEIELRNEGEPVHVHLRFDGPLAAAASLPESNHYVDAGASRTVRASVASVDEPVEGVLEVVTGHGAETAEVAVRLEPPEEDDVPVDESFASPPAGGSRDPHGGADARSPTGWRAVLSPLVAEGGVDAGAVAVGALVVAVLALAAVVVATFDGVAVLLGAGAVVIAVAAALYLLVA